MNLEILPQFLSVDRRKQGEGLGISRDDYGFLARSWVCIVQDLHATTAASRLPGDRGCAVHIWTKDRYLIVAVNSQEQRLRLFFSDNLDSPSDPTCILELSNSQEDWKRLGQIARSELLKDES